MVEIIDIKTRQKTVVESSKPKEGRSYCIRVVDPSEQTGLADFEVTGSLVIDPYWCKVTAFGNPVKVFFACPSQRVVWCQDMEGWEEIRDEDPVNDN